jgi:carbohydrate kinase (thermoresistant glucokinase family)
MRERSVYHHLSLAARKKIVAIPADFSSVSLGLEHEVYSQIASEITGLIHCAWSVNFNLGLGSFEADCIAGAHNLMTLCLKAQRPEPATFNFCSSVSAVASTKGGFVREALPESLECAQNMGYAQSKLVTEHICIAAGKTYGLKARVLRIGQVVADTVHGIWNSTEAIPLMMQAGLTIGAIPRLDENPLWLPVDVVASAVADISLSSAGSEVMNVVNHESFHWTRDLLPALHKAGIDFAEPIQQEWVALLRTSNPDPVVNPPIKLVEFFSKKYDNDLPRTGLTYDTSYARFLSPSLTAAPLLDQQLVDKFVKQFKESSWTPVPANTSTKRLIVIAGPCGTGKSTVAKALAKGFGIPWIEGDSLHSEASVIKMSAGTPLSDSDRWLWLDTIKATAFVQLMKEGVSDIIVTCSALKRSYRDDLRQSRGLKTVFVILQGGEEVLQKRMGEREGHYMGAGMLESQLASLEEPGVDEIDVIPVDIEPGKEQVIAEVLGLLSGVISV